MSRAFVNEDGPEGPPPVWTLPDRDDPAFPLAAARALLDGANRGDTAAAEAATGLFWGDPALVDVVKQIASEAVESGDERLEVLAERFLKKAGRADKADRADG